MPNLVVIILNIDKNVEIHQKNLDVKELANMYGLYDIKRVYKHQNQPCSKIMAKCKSIFQFIQLLKYGITFGKSGKRHPVLPRIINYKICEHCGDLNHREKDCIREHKCLKCGEIGHQAKKCKSKAFKCLNCSGPHESYSDQCERLAEKKLSINDFTIKILLGERFITNKYDILLNQNVKGLESMTVNNDQESLIESLVNKNVASWVTKMQNLEERAAYQMQNLKSIQNKMNDLERIFLAAKENLESLKKSISKFDLHFDLISDKNKEALDEVVHYLENIYF